MRIVEGRLGRYLPVLWSLGKRVVAGRKFDVVREDPDDSRILECAIAADAGAIVTGDRHLLRLGEYEGIAVLTPREFLTRL